MDKFGRHVNTVKLRKEMQRYQCEEIRLRMTNDGHVDVKKIRKLGKDVDSNDAVSLNYFQAHYVFQNENSVNVKGG